MTAHTPQGGQPPNDEMVDQTVEDSFPASDPPSQTPPSGARRAEARQGAARADGEDAISKGHPTSDRDAVETTAGRVEGHEPPQRKSE